MNIPPGKALDIILRNGDDTDKSRLETNAPSLKKLAKLDRITWMPSDQEAPVSATALVGNLEILVPMAGLIDKEAELARLAKEIEKLGKDLARIEGKLSNSSFVDRAPAEVVDKERAKLADQQQALEKLREQEQRILAM
jgi:valyl-tRNA synthetase